MPSRSGGATSPCGEQDSCPRQAKYTGVLPLRSASVRTLVAAAVALTASAASAGVSVHGVAASSHPALFRVGAAVESVAPPVAVSPGGYGSYDATAATRRQYQQLQVRAFYVSNGRHAVEFAVLDSQAWFAAYQEGAFGISDARSKAAATISSRHLGPAMAASDIIIQGSHSHSAPTLEGIWGPVPVTYLRLVHDRAVAALVAAARAARPAYLQWGATTSRNIDDVAIADDTLPGWDVDGQISVLRGVDPHTGATVASFVSVPAHPVVIDGQDRHILGPDYFGPLRNDLQRMVGGTVVAGPATLGRQEPPVQTTDYAQLDFYADALAHLVARALGSAHYVTDPTLASSEQMLPVPGTNAAILALAAANVMPDAQKKQFADTSTLYPIDRQITPPYEVGTTVVTPLTAIRVGPVLMLSMPGEPYPEVRQAVVGAVSGASLIVGLSKGQDDLGYFMPSWTYGFGVAEGTDHPIFSVAPWMGDEVAAMDAKLAGDVGFATSGLPASLPAPRDFQQAFQPGLQALADGEAGDAGADGRFHPRLEAIFNAALYGGAANVGGVHWDFGDGTHATTGYLLTATGQKGKAWVDHGFRPGRTYTVSLRAVDANGSTATWSLRITAYPRLVPVVTRRAVRGGVLLTALVRGGDGHLVAAHWHVPGIGTVDGARVVVPASVAHAVTVTVVDGTGSSATG